MTSRSRSRYPFYFAIFLLIAAGLGLAILRHVEMGIPWLTGEQRPVWMVEARIDFEAMDGPVLASLNIPDNPPGFRLLSEQAASPGYGFSIVQESGNRRAEWSKRSATGPQTLYFKVQLIPDNSQYSPSPKIQPQPDTVFWEEPQATIVQEVLQQAAEKSSNAESMTRELIKLMQPDNPVQNTTLLTQGENYVNLLSRMLNHAGIPARIADGLQLEDARRQQSLKPFLQIYNGKSWLTFNPQTGEQGLPERVVLWRQAAVSLLDVTGGSDSQVSFAMLRQTVPALQLARAESSSNGLGFLSLY